MYVAASKPIQKGETADLFARLRSKMPPQAQSRPSSLFESFTHAAAKMEAGWSFPDEWQTYVPNWMYGAREAALAYG